MITLKDQLQTIHTFTETPVRIVSLVPSQTELLYDLGLEDSIVGITKFCVHPYHLKAKKILVGGTKQVHFDKILALQPDIIICNKEENTPEIVAQCSKTATVWVTDIITIADNQQMIIDFGKIFNKRVEAQKWIDKIDFAYQDFLYFMLNIKPKKVAYFIWANPYMVAGNNTFINEFLKLNKFENIYEKLNNRYPEIAIQEIQFQGDPDFVFLSSEPFPFSDTHAFEIGRYTHHAKTVFVDGEMFSWYGSRILKSFAYFKKLHQKL